MDKAYNASLLPLDNTFIDQTYFFEELIDATTKLEVYKEKIKDSKLDSSWFMPTLQQKEALASSQLEGTQATLDGVLVNQVVPNDKDKNLNEVSNYYVATVKGHENYIGKNDRTHAITFIPSKPEDVPILMNNLIEYINNPSDKYRPLVRTAIMHAQFETIHPFMDGNGRVGRMLIPM